jgi:hypothetical protein
MKIRRSWRLVEFALRDSREMDLRAHLCGSGALILRELLSVVTATLSSRTPSHLCAEGLHQETVRARDRRADHVPQSRQHRARRLHDHDTLLLEETRKEALHALRQAVSDLMDARNVASQRLNIAIAQRLHGEEETKGRLLVALTEEDCLDGGVVFSLPRTLLCHEGRCKRLTTFPLLRLNGIPALALLHYECRLQRPMTYVHKTKQLGGELVLATVIAGTLHEVLALPT